MEFYVKTVRTSFLWWKKVHFEVITGDVTRYYYSIADLVSKLIEMETEELDIWKVLCNVQKFYKVR
jgi:hypothetical protein